MVKCYFCGKDCKNNEIVKHRVDTILNSYSNLPERYYKIKELYHIDLMVCKECHKKIERREK